MHLMKPLTFALVLGLASCTPETYLDPISDVPDTLTERPDAIAGPSGFTATESTSNALPDLRMDIPYQWTGCHGEGRMTFLADSTMIWDIDGQTFGSPYLLDEEGNLYPGCAAECEDMIAYRFDPDMEAWRQWDGFCWYELRPAP